METPDSRWYGDEPRRATLEKDQVVNFENHTEPIESSRRSGRGSIDCVRPEDYWRRSSFIVRMVGAMMMLLAMRGGLTTTAMGRRQVKTVKSTIYFGCPVWFVNRTENLFWLPQYCLTMHILTIFNFLSTSFSYALLFAGY